MLPLPLLVAAGILAAPARLGSRPNNRASSLVMKDRVWVERTPVRWDTIPPAHVARYLAQHFDGAASEATLGDVFFVWRIPAAVILYDEYTSKGAPIVTDVRMNRTLLLISGMAGAMRATLAERYPTIAFDSSRRTLRAYYEIP